MITRGASASGSLNETLCNEKKQTQHTLINHAEQKNTAAPCGILTLEKTHILQTMCLNTKENVKED